LNASFPDLTPAVRDFLAEHGAEQAPLAVAFSGGADSAVLLHVLGGLRDASKLRALHVDHGLHPDSAAWAEACLEQCDRLGVSCKVLRADLKEIRGESLEALAREARYRLLLGALHEDELLVTAHHRQDQLETVLLALLRGAGVHGLAAMPPAGRLLRPFLDIERQTLLY